ncbi:MAG: 3'-5' exonuclease [Acidobacteriota bacterium]
MPLVPPRRDLVLLPLMPPALDALHDLTDAPWLALDTETTGLGPYDEIIEIALVNSQGRVALHSLVAPSRPITAKSTALHGLDAEAVTGAPTWRQLYPRIAPLLRSTPIVAWNAAFDLRLLRQSCARYHLPFTAPRILCLRAAYRERHSLTTATLQAASLALGLPVRPTHRALPDAQVAQLAARVLMGLPFER